MSWWDTGEGSDVIGDQPADVVRRALKQIADSRANRHQDKPELSDLLRALGLVAIGSSEDELTDGPAEAGQIVAELKGGKSILSGPLVSDPRSSDLVVPLREALRAVADAYKERWDRSPRFSEWLQATAFVLRYRPEDFLRDGAEHPPAMLKAV